MQDDAVDLHPPGPRQRGPSWLRDHACDPRGTGGRIEILPGTLYATIKVLLADGLIQEVPPPKDADSADQRRRYYRVTKAGRAFAAEQTDQMAILVKLARPFLKSTR